MPQHRRPKRSLQRTIYKITLLAAITIIPGSIWFTFSKLQHSASGGEVPLVAADPTPMKSKPENPGGMQIPHLDKSIFSLFDRNANGANQEVQLRPKPEEPLPIPRPDPEPPAPDLTMTSDQTDQSQANGTGDLAGANGSKEDQLGDFMATLGLSGNSEVEDPGPDVSGLEGPDTNETATGAQFEQAQLAEETTKANAPPVQLNRTIPEPSGPSKLDNQSREQDKSATTRPAAQTLTTTAAGSRTTHRIQFASVRDEQSAITERQRLQQRHGAILGGITLQITQSIVTQKGTFYRIQSGPIGEGQARQICSQMKAKNAPCLITKG